MIVEGTFEDFKAWLVETADIVEALEHYVATDLKMAMTQRMLYLSFLIHDYTQKTASSSINSALRDVRAAGPTPQNTVDLLRTQARASLVDEHVAESRPPAQMERRMADGELALAASLAERVGEEEAQRRMERTRLAGRIPALRDPEGPRIPGLGAEIREMRGETLQYVVRVRAGYVIGPFSPYEAVRTYLTEQRLLDTDYQVFELEAPCQP